MKDEATIHSQIDGLRLDEIGLQQFAPYLMNRIMGRYNASLRDDLADLDLNLSKSRALAVLSVTDGPTISQLASYVMAKQSTLSRSLDSLEAEGLVRRITDATDNRATRLFITETGQALFEQLWPAMFNNYAHMFKGVHLEDLAAFVEMLHKILCNLNENDS